MDLSPSMQPDPAWSTAVPDWEARIREGKSLLPDLPLWDAPAEKALRVFKKLRISDMYGTPTYGEVCEDWVFDLVRVIFGSYNPDLKRRMLREFFLLVPKKNGKSAIAAGIILTAAILNSRPEAELVLISATQKIARITFKAIKGSILLDPVLEQLFHIQNHEKQITHRETGAMIMILSADGDIVTGLKAVYLLIDESHVLLSKTKADEILTELKGGLASNVEGFVIQITTQSKKPPVGAFKEELNKARAVRDGEIALPLVALLYEFPNDVVQKETWRDPNIWGMVNPNLERSVSLQYLMDELAAADRKGADAVALFASQHLNVQIGLGHVQDRWVGSSFWYAGKAKFEGLTLPWMMDLCDCMVGGIDGGGMDDLLGASFVGRRNDGGGWLSLSKAWCHPIALERRERDRKSVV